ncbi:MAG: hypothetical protein RJQ00_01840 [Vicingaceae bacterium]
MQKRRNKILLYFALVFLVALLSFVFFIETQFNKVEQKPFTQASSKNWAHRGYASTEKEENTLAAVALAFQKEYKGVEIDLWFKDGQFYISHEESYVDSLPKLAEVFEKFPDDYFWLDLKNLSYSNYERISNQLDQLKKSKKSYLIESKKGLPLGLLHKKGFKTSYWMTNGNFIRQFIQKCWIIYFKYNGISMPVKEYLEKDIRKKYKHLNIHLWDKHPNPKVYQWDEVKIVLDDYEIK